MSAKSGPTSTILKQYEVSLEQQWEPVPVDQLKWKVTRDANWLTAHQPIVASIQASLDEQRAVQASMWLQRLRHDSDHMRRATMGKRGSDIYYYAQRVWSLPYDYVSLPSVSKQDRSISTSSHPIDGLVFQVEHITDDFLMSLGLMTERDRLPPLDKISRSEQARLRQLNIDAKIRALPAFRSLLKRAVQLQTWEHGRHTGRILRIDGGQYLVFQEQKRAWSEKNKPYIHYAAKVYPTMYSLLRSQTYWWDGISENLERYSEIHMSLATLHTSWKMLSDEEKRKNIKDIKTYFPKSENPHIVSAMTRLLGIVYTNSENDSMRVLWAQNDIARLLTTQESKKWAIGYHWALIAHLVRSEEARFDSLRDVFVAWLKQIDASELMSYIDQKEGAKLSMVTKNQIYGAMGVLDTYIRAYHCNHMIWHPFSEFGYRLANRFSYSWSLLGQIRLILQSVLAIKKQSYWLMLHQTKHHIKNGQEPKDSIATVDKQIRFLEEKTFLPDLELNQSGIEKFTHLISNMWELKKILKANNPETSLEYIDSLIALGYPV